MMSSAPSLNNATQVVTWYTFSQTQDQIAVSFNLPPISPTATKKTSEYKPTIVIKHTSLSATLDHPDFPNPLVFIQGDLFQAIIPVESLWQVEQTQSKNDVKTITIHLEKKHPVDWPAVIALNSESDPTSLYYSGQWNELVNPALSQDLYTRGAQQGSVACMLKLGSIYTSPTPSQDYHQGMAWYEKASTCECSQYNARHVMEACYLQASAYQHGHFGIPVDTRRSLDMYQQMVSLYQQWAPIGNLELIKLALFQSGLLEFQNDRLQNTLEFWQQAAALEHPQSIYNLGVMYLNGIGVAKNVELGAGLMQRGVQLDSSGKLELPEGLPRVSVTTGQRSSPKNKRKKGRRDRRTGSLGRWIKWGLVSSILGAGIVYLVQRRLKNSV